MKKMKFDERDVGYIEYLVTKDLNEYLDRKFELQERLKEEKDEATIETYKSLIHMYELSIAKDSELALKTRIIYKEMRHE